ncbi:unnamed protein product [Linum tenue]|uniref:Glycosyltransferase n=1 Tax=Linum tenue TaxID=586396 RepID=A0AAV0NA71_9ROSI|nr:unnamed protein product [Linum tenue]
MARKPNVVIFPSPGMGHLIPLVELSKKLVLAHDLSITLIVPSLGPPSKAQTQVLKSLSSGPINHILLPPTNPSDFPAGTRAETLICLTVAQAVPALRDELKLLVETSGKPVALVADFFCTDTFDVAKEFDVPSYLAVLTNAMTLSMLLDLPRLDEEVSGEYGDMDSPIRFPGCKVDVLGSDLPDPVLDRKDDAYKWFMHNLRRTNLAEGFIVNSFTELEGETIQFLQQNVVSENKPIYPIGPIFQSGSSNDLADPSGCLKWLDTKPTGSVVFVSFGSGGTLSSEQLKELALGLETSQQNFLWVVRSPNDAAANASYFNSRSGSNPLDFLPEGFVERTKGRGLVVPSWAPQMEVLSHVATGGFVSHCGWNSTVESIVNGVPMIAWPLYAEQRMNAVLLEKDFEIALRPRAGENGVIGREEIARVVKGLMHVEEGAAVRERMAKLKVAAAEAVTEGGSSTKSLGELVSNWKKGH